MLASHAHIWDTSEQWRACDSINTRWAASSFLLHQDFAVCQLQAVMQVENEGQEPSVIATTIGHD